MNTCMYICIYTHIYIYIYVYIYVYIPMDPDTSSAGTGYHLWYHHPKSLPGRIWRRYSWIQYTMAMRKYLDPHGYIYIYDMYMYVDVDVDWHMMTYVYIYIHMCIHTHCMFIYIYWYAHTDHFWLGLIVTFLHTAWWRSPMFTFNIWPTSTQDGSDDIVFEVIDYSHSRSVSDSMYICSNTISSARVSQTSRLYPYKVRPQTIDQLVCSLHS